MVVSIDTSEKVLRINESTNFYMGLDKEKFLIYTLAY